MFTKRLSKLLKDNKIKNTELANYLKVSKSAVSKWLSGEAEPRPDTLRQMAKYFNVSVGYLINNEDFKNTITTPESRSDIYPSIVYSMEEPEYTKGIVWLPVFETKISATPGVQDIIREDIIGWHSAPESLMEMSGNDPYTRPFSMKVEGKSMMPLIKPGDYLTVRPAPFIVPEPYFIYAVRINDDTTDTYGIIAKRVQVDTARGLLLLKSDNPDFPVYVIENDKATIIGRVISVWRPL